MVDQCRTGAKRTGDRGMIKGPQKLPSLYMVVQQYFYKHQRNTNVCIIGGGEGLTGSRLVEAL